MEARPYCQSCRFAIRTPAASNAPVPPVWLSGNTLSPYTSAGPPVARIKLSHCTSTRASSAAPPRSSRNSAPATRPSASSGSMKRSPASTGIPLARTASSRRSVIYREVNGPAEVPPEPGVVIRAVAHILTVFVGGEGNPQLRQLHEATHRSRRLGQGYIPVYAAAVIEGAGQLPNRVPLASGQG